MANHSHKEAYDAGESALCFASLTAASIRTLRDMGKVLDTIYNQLDDSAHHKSFIRRQAGPLAATRSPDFSPEPFDSSSGFTTEADQSDDDEFSLSAATCYILSLSRDAHPYQPEVGYWFGTGDLTRFPVHAGVDLLLPPPALETSLQSSSLNNNLIYPRQGYFAFDSKYGQLWLHARHKGIRVEDRPLAPRSKILLDKRTRISIGPYRYIFEFQISDEKVFQAAKRDYLSEFRRGGIPHESTSATPSASDVRIQDWRLHGVVGASPVSVIHAATNVRSGEVVAVKRLRFGASTNNAEEEVQLYDQILSSISGHRYSCFVMHKHSVLANELPYNPVREVYLLWKPLARGDFAQFGELGRWRKEPESLKTTLFVQILLGLSALHDCGWIHRDLKPANLGVVEFGEKPHAIIMDEAQAIREAPEGHMSSIAHCGTIGYLAPELENNVFAPAYDKGVDVWSMGAISYFLFFAGKIPWSVRFNMFVPARDAREPSLHLFREVRAGLIAHPVGTLGHLTGQMLDENPRRRPEISQILAHPAIQGVRAAVERDLEAQKSAGQKRSRDS